MQKRYPCPPPEEIMLLQKHDFDLVFQPPGFPIVFTHDEIMHPLVVIATENNQAVRCYARFSSWIR
jgi:hypothetical protein